MFFVIGDLYTQWSHLVCTFIYVYIVVLQISLICHSIIYVQVLTFLQDVCAKHTKPTLRPDANHFANMAPKFLIKTRPVSLLKVLSQEKQMQVSLTIVYSLCLNSQFYSFVVVVVVFFLFLLSVIATVSL